MTFELGAVQKCASLVDFEKCSKMSISLQKSASIHMRTSPDKFVVRLELASPDLESFLSLVRAGRRRLRHRGLEARGARVEALERLRDAVELRVQAREVPGVELRRLVVDDRAFGLAKLAKSVECCK